MDIGKTIHYNNHINIKQTNMKHIIVEGGDNLGKDTLIKSICEYFNYDNITLRHFGKPPKNLLPKESLDFQMKTFYKEILFVSHIKESMESDNYGYFPNVVIWNRSHLGEYVYSQMFRGIMKRDIKTKLSQFEKDNFDNDTYLVTLTAAPKFFLSKEDGYSFSQNLDQKSKELDLFKEAHEFSSILNKKIIKVNKGNEFRDKDEIFKEFLLLIEEKNPIYE